MTASKSKPQILPKQLVKLQLQQQNHQPLLCSALLTNLLTENTGKIILIIYNLPESSDQSKDTAFFNELYQLVLTITAKITNCKSVRLNW